ncbi:MAG: LTA synthase family protein [Bacteroidales bacterium]|nr:LTA synthase family protein [Bacteroidales bacterium]
MTVYLADSIMLLAPLWVLKRKGYAYGAIAAITVAIVTYANILYYRYWQSFIPVDAIFSANSYNSFVFDSIRHLVRPADIITFISGIIPLASYILLKVKDAGHVSRKFRATAITLSVAAFVTATLLSALSINKYNLSNGDDTSTISKVVRDKFSGEIPRWKNNGCIIYTINSFFCKWLFNKHLRNKSSITPDAGEIELIESFVSMASTYHHKPDSVFAHNRHKNLILIIVESLNSSVIGARYGNKSITPTIDSLLDNEGTIAALNVIPQINFGGSADGQMIYNTGLLPISNSVAANLYGDNVFHSLAGSSRFAEKAEIICENGTVWNHRTTSISYGYDHLYEKKDFEQYGITDSQGEDAALFDMAIKIIGHMRQPFMLELTTISMHFPFNDANATAASDIPDRTIDDRYLRMTNYFDRQLGIFIDRLKADGIYDNSVIVIASDHHFSMAEVTDDMNDRSVSPIAFIALNTGHTERIVRTVGQADVYPTILEITGIGDTEIWHGVGMSILDPANRSAVDRNGDLHGTSGDSIDERKRRAWQASDLIIRSNYFQKR